MIDTPLIISRDLGRAPFSHQYSIFNIKNRKDPVQDSFHRPLFEITAKFLDPCIVPYLVVTLILYHGLFQLRMKKNDQILVYYHLSLSDVQAGYEKET